MSSHLHAPISILRPGDKWQHGNDGPSGTIYTFIGPQHPDGRPSENRVWSSDPAGGTWWTSTDNLNVWLLTDPDLQVEEGL